MAHRDFQILKKSDREILDSLRSLAEGLNEVSGAEIQLSFGQGHNRPIRIGLDDEKFNEVVEQIVESDLEVSQNIRLNITSRQSSVEIQRQPNLDTVKISFPDQADGFRIIIQAMKSLKPFERTGTIDKILGDELAEFYRRREEGLLRLEGLTQRLVESNEAYRRQLDAEHDSLKQQHQQKWESERESLEAEYATRHAELEAKRDDLERRAKDLDDRASRHVRREIRQDLKKALEARGVKFGLTRETTKKRMPIHVLFLTLIVVIGFVFVHSFLNIAEGGVNSESWYPLIKFALSIGGLAAAIVFYIRWNDRWFSQHADEEFRLKRLELDIDRASWVVEMALEWQEEKGSTIPQELVDRLTSGLFLDQDRRAPATHPSEDLASAIIAASSGLSLRIPGIGEVTLDRRGVRRFREAVEKAAEERNNPH